MDAALRRVADHSAQVAVDHRFAAHKEQVANVVLPRDVDHVARFLQRDAAALLRIKPVHGEPAEIAGGTSPTSLKTLFFGFVTGPEKSGAGRAAAMGGAEPGSLSVALLMQ